MASTTPYPTDSTPARQRFMEAMESRSTDVVLSIQDEVFPIIEHFTAGHDIAIRQLVEIICSEFGVEGAINISTQTIWGALLNSQWISFSEGFSAIHDAQLKNLPTENDYHLVAFNDGMTTGCFALDDAHTSLGRTPDNVIQLRGEAISRKHAAIHRSNNGLKLENINRANGTQVNGKSILHSELQEGDIIRVGHTRLMLVRGAACEVARIKQTPQIKASTAGVDAPAFVAAPVASTPKPQPAQEIPPLSAVEPIEPEEPLDSQALQDADTEPQIPEPEVSSPPLPEYSAAAVEAGETLEVSPDRPQITVLQPSERKISKGTLIGFGVTAALVGTLIVSSLSEPGKDNTTPPQPVATSDTSSAEPALLDTAKLPTPVRSEKPVGGEKMLAAANAEEAQISTDALIAEASSLASTQNGIMINRPEGIESDNQPLAAQLDSIAEPTIARPVQSANTTLARIAPTPAVRSVITESDEGVNGLAFAIDSLATGNAPVENEGFSTGNGDLRDILARARRQMAATKLTTPENDNALDSYLEAMSIAPGNREARNGIARIADTYLRLAKEADAKGNVIRAKEMLRRGLGVDPTHAGLAGFERQLENAPAEPMYQSINIPSPATETVADNAELPVADTIPMAASVAVVTEDTNSPDTIIADTIIEQPAAAIKSTSMLSPAPELVTTDMSLNQPPVKLNTSVEELLLKAERQELFRQVTSPPGDNAVETYRKVLRISPMHPDALSGLERIASRYFARAKLFEETEYLAEAISAAEKGLAVSPQHADLRQLHNHLTWRLSGKW